MAMPPFKKERAQRLFSIILIVVGVLLMITEEIYALKIGSLTINMFIVGALLAFAGILYFWDV